MASPEPVKRRGRPPKIHALEEVAPPPKEGKTPVDQTKIIRFYYPEWEGVEDEKLLAAADLSWRFGLDPSGVGGLARLVKKGEAISFVIGYRGCVALAMASGSFALIEARVVFDKDTFALDYGSQVLKHAPFDGEGDPGAIVGAYALSIERSGSRRLEFIPGRQILGLETIGLLDASEAAKKGVLMRLAANSPVDMPQLRYALDCEYRNLNGLPIPA
jgi:hypothetical protein